MYIQNTEMRLPPGKLDQFRQILDQNYFPNLREKPGYICGGLFEQTDDRDVVSLITFWENQGSVEFLKRTEPLSGSVHALSALLPGLQVSTRAFVCHTNDLLEALAGVR
jgi:quinol monooxygenase YgiN